MASCNKNSYNYLDTTIKYSAYSIHKYLGNITHACTRGINMSISDRPIFQLPVLYNINANIYASVANI